MKKKLLIVLCPILLLLGLSLGNIALAGDDLGCTNPPPAGYGGDCTNVGTDVNVWLKKAENLNWECVTGKCLSPLHKDKEWQCCREKECTSPNACVFLADCSDADKMAGTCSAINETCCKPPCDLTNCKEKCDGTFELDLSKSAASCTDITKPFCCKPTGGNTDPSKGGGKTEGATYPLGPLSPVGYVNIPTLIGYIIKGVLGIVGSIALLMFVYGGFLMLISQGDAAKIKKGKDALVWAAAGLVVIFGSYIFVNYILTNLGKGGT